LLTTDENEQFEDGILRFNAGQFFEAHEVWEQLWLRAPATEKAFLQGIIQIAAAFHHYGLGNLPGAKSLATAGVEKISKYPDGHRGMDVARLASDVQAWIEPLTGEKSAGRPWPAIHRIK
jgi:uncharacterized protein